MGDELQVSPLQVTPEESGLKLLRFLERRLEQTVTTGQLHKWIRTGQVRVNKKRAQAYMLVSGGDTVRIPPFAVQRHNGAQRVPLGDDLPVVAEKEGFIVLNKPSGLAVQGGSGITDSVAGRLARAYAGAAYIPAPVHRLDKGTSGIVLAGTAHEATKMLSSAFAEAGAIRKEYLAVAGQMTPYSYPHILVDALEKMPGPDRRERMYSMYSETQKDTFATAEDRALFIKQAVARQQAVTRVQQIQELALRSPDQRSKMALLHVVIYTGKTHQIRAQLASRGFALVGDSRYGGEPFPRLLLHAWRVTLPPENVFTVALDWNVYFQNPLVFPAACDFEQFSYGA